MKSLVRLLARGGGFTPGLKNAVEEARRAEDDWRLDDAATAWAAIQARFPDRALGVVGHARVLAKLNRHKEAVAVLGAASERSPQSALLVLERVRILHEFGAFEEALGLAQAALLRFPADPHAPELLGKCLRSLLRYAEADAVLDKARAAFPKHVGLQVEYAASADMRGDYPEGLRRSQTLLRNFPHASIAHASAGAALKRLKRYDEADAVLAAAIARFPDNSNLYVNYAWVADDRGDRQAALRRWSAAYERFGREPRIHAGFFESRARADLARIDEAGEAPGAAPLSEPPAASGESLAGLFTRFESLGENCEFGFVQRHYGTEPLGLLRWAGVSFDKLLAGLDNAFDGVGGPERTRMVVNPNNQEYVVSDTFYGFDMHTFILKDEANEAVIAKKMGRRLAYLRGKLLDDLAAAEKTFVFQSAQPLTDDDLLRLHAALRRHGQGRLLAVRLAGPEEVPGEVALLAEGLAAGVIDRVGYRDNHWDIAFGCWLDLARKALALLEPDAPQP